MSYSRMGDGFWEAIKALAWIAAIATPLAIWKAIEIVIWLFGKIEISIK